MSDAVFEIDPDIRLARTLPARVYSDPDLFRAQRDSVFARTWQFAAHDDLVKVAGQVYPFTLLPGALDEPLVLTRDLSDQIRCLSNVCTHRGTVVVEEAVAPMRARLAGLPFNALVYDAAGARDYLVNANWALYMDNYLEGFHIPYVHSSLAATLDYGEYAVELERYQVLQLAIAKPGEAAFALPPSHRDHARSIGAYYFWIFPTTMFNIYPWGVSVNVVMPLAVDRTRVSFLPFVWNEARRESGAGAGLDRVEREDEAIVEAVQRGVRSRLYERGRYSPAREGGVHHFHRLLAEFMQSR